MNVFHQNYLEVPWIKTGFAFLNYTVNTVQSKTFIIISIMCLNLSGLYSRANHLCSEIIFTALKGHND